MKWNTTLIITIFVLPLIVYTILSHNQNKAFNEVNAATMRPKMVMVTSPMCGECVKTKKELAKVRPQFEKTVTIEVLEANDSQAQPYIDKYNIKLVPTTFFFKKDGKLHKKIEGGLSAPAIEKELKEIQ